LEPAKGFEPLAYGLRIRLLAFIFVHTYSPGYHPPALARAWHGWAACQATPAFLPAGRITGRTPAAPR